MIKKNIAPYDRDDLDYNGITDIKNLLGEISEKDD